VTTRAAAEKAALTFRETQPAIDAIKDTMARNAAAKKVLGAYMIEKQLTIFRGILLKVVPFEGWDNDKLREYLGTKVSKFRRMTDRKYFDLKPSVTSSRRANQ
jgi:hypothetical protein